MFLDEIPQPFQEGAAHLMSNEIPLLVHTIGLRKQSSATHSQLIQLLQNNIRVNGIPNFWKIRRICRDILLLSLSRGHHIGGKVHENGYISENSI